MNGCHRPSRTGRQDLNDWVLDELKRLATLPSEEELLERLHLEVLNTLRRL